MAYVLEDVVLVAETDKALLVRNRDVAEEDARDEVNQWWLPRSQVHDTDLEEEGDVGYVELSGWLARKLGLD